jgi:hypothetical protein
MQFIEVEIVYALFCAYEYVLISCVWMDPACSAMDTERTTIKHLKNNVLLKLTFMVHQTKGYILSNVMRRQTCTLKQKGQERK